MGYRYKKTLLVIPWLSTDDNAAVDIAQLYRPEDPSLSGPLGFHDP